jgi:hypothetical protein
MTKFGLRRGAIGAFSIVVLFCMATMHSTTHAQTVSIDQLRSWLISGTGSYNDTTLQPGDNYDLGIERCLKTPCGQHNINTFESLVSIFKVKDSISNTQIKSMIANGTFLPELAGLDASARNPPLNVGDTDQTFYFTEPNVVTDPRGFYCCARFDDLFSRGHIVVLVSVRSTEIPGYVHPEIIFPTQVAPIASQEDTQLMKGLATLPTATPIPLTPTIEPTASPTAASPLPPLLMPSDPVMTPLDTTDLEVDWTADTEAVSGYELDDGNSGARIAVFNANTYTYTLHDLNSNTQYCVILYAYNSSGYSPPSNVVCAATPSP